MSGNAAAIVFLLLFVGAWLAWVLVVLRRPPLTPMQNVLMLVNRLITSLLWRTTAPRDVPLPPGRGGIIVCNHRSSIDPCFVQRGTQRPIHWMVAKEFVANPALRWFMDTCMMILVNRGGVDTAATKIALRYVQKGEVIGMFPEGRINTTRRLMISVRPGAAMIAIKTRAIVLPCYISGSPYGGTVISPLFMPARVTVRYGEPIDAIPYINRIEAGEDEAAVTLELLRTTIAAIAQLAGQPEFEPEIAGRVWNKKASEESEEAASSSLAATPD